MRVSPAEQNGVSRVGGHALAGSRYIHKAFRIP